MIGVAFRDDPLVSVLIPAFNSAAHLPLALRSVVNQTYSHLEIIVVDDASSDGTSEIAASFGDSRIRIHRNDKQRGIAATRNRCVDLANGEFVAWMDSDDVSLPRRIERQILFLQRNPQVAAVGSDLLSIGTTGEVLSEPWMPPILPAAIKWGLIFGTPFFNGTTMARSSVYELLEPYDSSLVAGSDNEFWIRCADSLNLANVPDVLLLYRRHETSISNVWRADGAALGARLTKERLERLLNTEIQPPVAQILRAPSSFQEGDVDARLEQALTTLYAAKAQFFASVPMTRAEEKSVDLQAELLYVKLMVAAARATKRPATLYRLHQSARWKRSFVRAAVGAASRRSRATFRHWRAIRESGTLLRYNSDDESKP